jgi:hypothetical protein
MSGAECPRCGCAGRFPGRVVWCSQCGWMDERRELEEAEGGAALELEAIAE